MPHESVLELEVLTGDGSIVTARPDGEHRDLFYGMPNSYGTLGYALRVKIELEPVKPYVRLRHVRFSDREECFATMDSICSARSFEGETVDFIDGTVFSRDEMYLTLATFVDEAPSLGDYTGMEVYYRSIQERSQDFLTVHDYLWRWDTDWFWCSRVFGVQNPRIRRWVPKRWLRSDSYWKLIELERRYGPYRRFAQMRGYPPEEDVVQDVELPIDRAGAFFDFFVDEVPISPFWLCPVRLRDETTTWPLYGMKPGVTYVNFGFWSSVPLASGERDGDHNRRIEAVVDELGGHKSLYSTSFYEPDEFWRLYNGPAYGELKRSYDRDGRLLDLYEKCVERR